MKLADWHNEVFRPPVEPSSCRFITAREAVHFFIRMDHSVEDNVCNKPVLSDKEVRDDRKSKRQKTEATRSELAEVIVGCMVRNFRYTKDTLWNAHFGNNDDVTWTRAQLTDVTGHGKTHLESLGVVVTPKAFGMQTLLLLESEENKTGWITAGGRISSFGYQQNAMPLHVEQMARAVKRSKNGEVPSSCLLDPGLARPNWPEVSDLVGILKIVNNKPRTAAEYTAVLASGCAFKAGPVGARSHKGTLCQGTNTTIGLFQYTGCIAIFSTCRALRAPSETLRWLAVGEAAAARVLRRVLLILAPFTAKAVEGETPLSKISRNIFEEAQRGLRSAHKCGCLAQGHTLRGGKRRRSCRCHETAAWRASSASSSKPTGPSSSTLPLSPAPKTQNRPLHTWSRRELEEEVVSLRRENAKTRRMQERDSASPPLQCVDRCNTFELLVHQMCKKGGLRVVRTQGGKSNHSAVDRAKIDARLAKASVAMLGQLGSNRQLDALKAEGFPFYGKRAVQKAIKRMRIDIGGINVGAAVHMFLTMVLKAADRFKEFHHPDEERLAKVLPPQQTNAPSSRPYNQVAISSLMRGQQNEACTYDNCDDDALADIELDTNVLRGGEGVKGLLKRLPQNRSPQIHTPLKVSNGSLLNGSPPSRSPLSAAIGSPPISEYGQQISENGRPSTCACGASFVICIFASLWERAVGKL